MPALPPDVELALAAVARLDLEAWPILGSSLVQPVPWIRTADAQRLLGLRDWITAHATSEQSLVLASLMNLGRVLADLNLALHYDLELRNDTLRVVEWYRPFQGRARHEQEVRWGTHVHLIRSLAVELACAINLVLTRVDRAAPSARSANTMAVLEIGPGHASMQVVAYRGRDARLPQPYPGLGGLPQAIATRPARGLGRHHDNTARTAGELDAWIAYLVQRAGQGSGAPPARRPLPLALPAQPPSPPDRGEPDAAVLKPVGTGAGKGFSGPLAAFWGVIGAAAIVGAVVEHAWLLGSALGAALAAALLHRWFWRRNPQPLSVVAVLAMAGAGLIAADVLTARQHKPVPSGARTAHSGASHAPPPGRFQGGAASLLVADVTHRLPLRSRQRAYPCDVLQYRVALHNRGPGDLSQVRVGASINAFVKRAAIVPTVTLYSPSAPTQIVMLQARVHLRVPQTQTYLPRSTELLDAAHRIVRSSALGTLPDGIADGEYGIDVGDIQAGVTDYVRFRTRLGCDDGRGAPRAPFIKVPSAGSTSMPESTPLSSMSTSKSEPPPRGGGSARSPRSGSGGSARGGSGGSTATPSSDGRGQKTSGPVEVP